MSLQLVMVLAYTVIVPAMAGVWILYKRKANKEVRILSLLFIISLAVEILATLFRVYFRNNIVVINTAFVVEGWFLVLFVTELLKDKSYSVYFIIVGFALTLISLIEFSFKGNVFLNISFTVKNLLMIAGLFLIVWETAKGLEINNWLYYIVGGLLVYHVYGLIYFMILSPTLNKDILLFTSYIHSIINALLNLFYGIAIWNLSDTKQSLSPS